MLLESYALDYHSINPRLKKLEIDHEGEDEHRENHSIALKSQLSRSKDEMEITASIDLKKVKVLILDV